MKSRITLLHAPPGFGKTALLASCCRRLQDDGVTVAWLSLDEYDSPEALAGYLALAFEEADLIATSARTSHGGLHGGAALQPGDETRAGYRISSLIGAIERHGAPCFLALDEVERLTSPEVVATLNLLVGAMPANLHLAMAFRVVPPGLDIATLLLDGAATVVETADLRFSKAEVARFFDSKLSRRKLAAVAAESEGWPIALRIYRNAGRPDGSADTVGADAAAVWIESRLWRGVSTADRDFVLDIALFDWFDPDLIDEATGTLNSRRRLEVMGALAGLLQTSAGSGTAMRLHPLIRDHCANRRFAENPARFREIHRAIARALARRGQILDALRHASEASDATLIGRIALEAGGIRLWIKRGFGALRTVDQYLTADIVAAHPRLALVRCLVLAISGNVGEADRVFAQLGSSPVDSHCEQGDNQALTVDRLLVFGMLGLMSCTTPTTFREYVRRMQSLDPPENMGSMERGLLKCSKAIIGNMTGKFDEALEWCDRSRSEIGRAMHYISCHVDYQAGLACMALGRTRDAERWYRRGLDDTRKRRLGDSSTILFGEILAAELELERSAGPPALRPPPPPVLGECGAWLDAYAAATKVAMELALHEHGVTGALKIVDDAREYARRTGRVALGRLCCALRVSQLVADGRLDEADRTWRMGELPVEDDACIDLECLFWREVEAVGSARLDLLVARRNHQRARTLAARLLDVAKQHGMMRTTMRILATAVRLEASAGNAARAREHLRRFVALYETTDYARSLAYDHEVAMPMLERVAGDPDDSLASTARRLSRAIVHATAQPPVDAPLTLTRQEREILDRIEAQTDAEIARGMHMTYDALRYRVRRLFTKLDARSRHDAVHKARALGFLPPPDPSP